MVDLVQQRKRRVFEAAPGESHVYQRRVGRIRLLYRSSPLDKEGKKKVKDSKAGKCHLARKTWAHSLGPLDHYDNSQ